MLFFFDISIVGYKNYSSLEYFSMDICSDFVGMYNIAIAYLVAYCPNH